MSTDVNHLDRYPFVLLIILISFVCSIATSVVTVALLSQDSQPVSETVNRVIERTIEKVSPTTKEIVLVREDTLALSALESGWHGIVSVTFPDKTSVTGFSISSTALILPGTLSDSVKEITIENTTHEIVEVTSSDTSPFTKVTLATPLSLSPLPFGAVPKAGQSVLIAGPQNTFIKTSITKITPVSAEFPATVSLDAHVSESFVGSPVLSLDGVVIGAIGVLKDSTDPVVIAADSLKKLAELHN